MSQSNIVSQVLSAINPILMWTDSLVDSRRPPTPAYHEPGRAREATCELVAADNWGAGWLSDTLLYSPWDITYQELRESLPQLKQSPIHLHEAHWMGALQGRLWAGKSHHAKLWQDLLLHISDRIQVQATDTPSSDKRPTTVATVWGLWSRRANVLPDFESVTCGRGPNGDNNTLPAWRFPSLESAVIAAEILEFLQLNLVPVQVGISCCEIRYSRAAQARPLSVFDADATEWVDLLRVLRRKDTRCGPPCRSEFWVADIPTTVKRAAQERVINL